jgi:hypothetical protein
MAGVEDFAEYTEGSPAMLDARAFSLSDMKLKPAQARQGLSCPL